VSTTKDLRDMSFMELLGSLKTYVEATDQSLKLAPVPILESCSAVTRADWPTRQNDSTCHRQALAICMNSGCEALLCVIHAEICPICGQEFCEGCFDDHQRVHADN
jgi:hypothetical protein